MENAGPRTESVAGTCDADARPEREAPWYARVRATEAERASRLLRWTIRVVSPSCAMVSAAILILLSLADYRVGSYLADANIYEVPPITRIRVRPDGIPLVEASAHASLTKSGSWLKNRIASALAGTELAGHLSSSITSASARMHASLTGTEGDSDGTDRCSVSLRPRLATTRARSAAAATVFAAAPHEHDSHARKRDDDVMVLEETLVAGLSCEGPRPLEMAAATGARPGDRARARDDDEEPTVVGWCMTDDEPTDATTGIDDDAFTAGWLLQSPSAYEDDEDGDFLADSCSQRGDHAAEHAAERNCTGSRCEELGFDPLAAPQFTAGATHDRSNPSAAFHAFLSSQGDAQHTVPFTREISHRIERGETVSHVLDSAGIMPDEVGRWVSAANAVYNLNHVYAGQALSLSVDMRSSTLAELALEIDRRNMLVAKREGNSVIVRRERIPYKTTLRVVESEIRSSLYMAAMAQGIPEQVISDMAEILGWRIDFAHDIRPGAKFRVVYEELTREGATGSLPGRVLAVEVNNRGKRDEGFYFTPTEDQAGAYYDRDGEALGRYFLRYPVEFSRISSRFSDRRFHPVLKNPRPHYGVDFAAPTGTPVKALAAGKVLKAAWIGGNGRFVKIAHDGVYESGYAHLSRIADGIVPGARVEKGQIIGYVGQTGLATGPHLHLALYRNGQYIDPLTAELPRAQPLDTTQLAMFRATVEAIDRAYARADGGNDRLASIPAPTVAP